MVEAETLDSSDSELRFIYGEEEGCDVVFLVGQDEPTRWRLPAHSAVLKRTNVVFSKMFSEPYFPTDLPREVLRDGTGAYTVHVTDVDGRALDNLLRCLYREPVSVQNIDTALLTLYAGHKYQCPDLVNLCVSHLIDNRKETNVLSILKDVRVYVGDYQRKEIGVSSTVKADIEVQPVPRNQENEELCTVRLKNIGSLAGSATVTLPRGDETTLQLLPGPTGPVTTQCLDSSSRFSLSLETIESSCSDLLQSCLCFVDSNAVSLLQSDEFEDLDLASISLILSRDTLDVPDEIKVFQALLRWADKECKRKHLPLTSKSKREVLQESLFLPRYLTMSLSAFTVGPAASGIFADEEIYIIKSLLSGQVTLESVLVTTCSLRPYLYMSKVMRKPVPSMPPPPIPSAPPRPSRKRLSSLLFFRVFRQTSNKCCCRSKTLYSSGSESSTPSSSPDSSPTHQPSPPRNPTAPPPQLQRRESHPPRINVVEQAVICFACLFD